MNLLCLGFAHYNSCCLLVFNQPLRENKTMHDNQIPFQASTLRTFSTWSAMTARKSSFSPAGSGRRARPPTISWPPTPPTSRGPETPSSGSWGQTWWERSSRSTTAESRSSREAYCRYAFLVSRNEILCALSPRFFMLSFGTLIRYSAERISRLWFDVMGNKRER